MIRTLITLAAGIGVGVAVTFADDDHKAVKVIQLSQREISEKIEGKKATATVLEVLAVILHPRDAKETTIPEKGKE